MRRIAVLLGGLLLGWFGMTGAHAHADLVSMDPAANSTIAAPIDVVRLTFGEDITMLGTTVVVLDPTGHDIATGMTIQGPIVSVALGQFADAGEYHVNYRVNSVDGHIVEGSAAFTYEGSTPTPTAIATMAGGGDDDEYGESGESELGMGVSMAMLGLLVIIVIGGIVYAMSARRNGPKD